jgi:hypothetical protein
VVLRLAAAAGPSTTRRPTPTITANMLIMVTTSNMLASQCILRTT